MSFRPQDLRRLINTHGKNLTYVSKGSATYDPTTGGTTSTDVTATVRGYFYNYEVGDITGSNILLGDRRLVLPAVDTSNVAITAPKKGDTFAGEGDTVVVVTTDRILSGSNVMCYICQVRE